MNEHLHQLYHKCIKEIEEEWDKYASFLLKNHIQINWINMIKNFVLNVL